MATALAEKPEGSLPLAMQSWGDTKAAYRFLDNDKVTAQRVVAPTTRPPCSGVRAPRVVLAVQDTTVISLGGKQVKGVGPVGGPLPGVVRDQPLDQIDQEVGPALASPLAAYNLQQGELLGRQVHRPAQHAAVTGSLCGPMGIGPYQ